MPLSTSTRRGGLLAVLLRECRRMGSASFYILGLLVLPVIGSLLLIATFGDGVVRNLPISAVDLDRTPLSRRLVQMLDSTPGLRVIQVEADMPAARERVLRGESYGIVAVPANFERDVSRGSAPRVSVFYNAQYLLPASTVRKEATAILAALSASVEFESRVAAGQSAFQAAQLVEPIVADTHTLFNPSLSYVPYLITGLLPTMLQLFVMVMAVFAFGSELKDGTAGDWMAAAGGSTWRAFAGKALPYAVHFTVMGLLMLSALFGWLRIPLLGSFPVILGATVLLVLAYLGMGFAAVALTGNLRLATSLAAFYAVPAFAFVGLTFPIAGMPAAGQAWSSLLPLTHYTRLLVDQALRGAPVASAHDPLVVLATFAVVPWIVLGWRMGALARNPRAWGRL